MRFDAEEKQKKIGRNHIGEPRLTRFVQVSLPTPSTLCAVRFIVFIDCFGLKRVVGVAAVTAVVLFLVE